MAFEFEWEDRNNDEDYVLADDVNYLAQGIQNLAEEIENIANEIPSGTCLPEVTPEDADKIATVDEFGNWVAKNPLITKDENGRIIIPQANSEFIYSKEISVGTNLQLWGDLFIGSTKQASVPEPTEADEGKFLMVQNGEVAYVDIPSFEGSEF